MQHLDLFSGYGGFALAMRNNGIKTVAFSEVDKHAISVFRRNFPGVKNLGDAGRINPRDIPDCGIITGGTPCQDLSISGKRKGLKGERSGLFYSFVEIIKNVKPHYFIWENVRGALSSNGGRDFATIINNLSQIGYDLQWDVLNTKDFGIPQNRERIFIVGTHGKRGGRQIFPIRTDIRKINKLNVVYDTKRFQGYRVYKNNMAVAITGGGGPGSSTGLYLTPIINNKGKLEKRENINCIDANYYKGMDNHGQRSHLLDGQRVRRLTPKECERLQGLPDDWTKAGIDESGNEIAISDTQRYKMLGNGVTVNVVDAIVKRLLDAN